MKKLSGTKKTLKNYLFMQLIGWLSITLADWTNEVLGWWKIQSFIVFVFPSLFIVYYIFYQIRSGDIKEKFYIKVLYKVYWFGMGMLFMGTICLLVDENHWIIPQEIANPMYGVEYGIFGLSFVWVNTIVFFIFDFFVLLYYIIKNYGLKQKVKNRNNDKSSNF